MVQIARPRKDFGRRSRSNWYESRVGLYHGIHFKGESRGGVKQRLDDVQIWQGDANGIRVKVLLSNIGNMNKAARKLGGRGAGTLEHAMRQKMRRILRRTLVASVQKYAPVGPWRPPRLLGPAKLGSARKKKEWKGGHLRKSVKPEGTASKPRLRVGRFTYAGIKWWYVWPVTRGWTQGKTTVPPNMFIYRGIRAGWGKFRGELEEFAYEYCQAMIDRHSVRIPPDRNLRGWTFDKPKTKVFFPGSRHTPARYF